MSVLFSPLEIGKLHFDNRIFVAPMCQYSASGGVPGSWHLQHYGALAVGGAAAMTIEATAVSAEGRITEGCLGLYDDEQECGLAALVQHLRRLSSIRVGIQLTHAGRKGSCQAPWDGGGGLGPGGWPLLAPSAIAFGLIHQPQLAEHAVAHGRADCVAIGRAMLFDPRWALKAAMSLGVQPAFPRQYGLGSPRSWPGAAAAFPGY